MCNVSMAPNLQTLFTRNGGRHAALLRLGLPRPGSLTVAPLAAKDSKQGRGCVRRDQAKKFKEICSRLLSKQPIVVERAQTQGNAFPALVEVGAEEKREGLIHRDSGQRSWPGKAPTQVYRQGRNPMVHCDLARSWNFRLSVRRPTSIGRGLQSVVPIGR
jgi:hypothetical protein